MVRLNKNFLDQKQINDLILQLAKVISPSDYSHTNVILSELLGNEERIMFAKRLAVVILLTEGTSRYKVSQILKLSQSTVEKTAKKMEEGHFDTVLKKVGRTKKDYFAFLDTLDSILHLGGILPHYNGLDRYKAIR
jgi:DNA-binding NarL/FixJ family response regulator